MFVFGTQYLRGATPERDQWEKDMYNMKSYGFNTIRAWLVWNAIERYEGEIDYDYLDSFLTLAKKYDLDVGLLFHLHASPAWAAKKFSKYFYVNEDSLPFEPAVRPNTPGGGWPGLCFDNPEVRDLEESFIRRVISHTKNYENVSFYEPMNEPHQWIDLRKDPCGVFCYCDASVKKFRVWLKKKYESISALNSAWGSFYTDFDEVRPPRWFPSYSDYTDWRIFAMDNVAEEISFRSDIIRDCDTKPVIAHAWGGGATTCGQLGGMAFDDWKNAKVFDKWGYSAFPYKAADCPALGLGCDSTRCAAGDKDYWQSELGAGIEGVNLSTNGRIDDNTFDKFSLESIRHGAKGLLYWQYRMERYGPEFAGYSLTDYDGGPTNLSLRASKICKMLQENDKVFNEGKQAPAEVALVFSVRSYIADWASNGKKDNRFAVDSMTGYYKMFWEENISVDILHEEFAQELERYKLIVLPSSFAISPTFSKKLVEYIKNGGFVISEPFYGVYDESMALSRQVPGHGTAEMFGARQDDIKSVTKLDISDSSGKKYEFFGNRHKETYKDVTADTLYTYDDGKACIIGNRYGKGYAVMSGINLGLCYSNKSLVSDDITSNDKANTCIASKKIVMEICKKACVKGNICSVAEVKVSHIKTDEKCDADIMILINSSSQEKSGKIEISQKYSSCSDVYGNACCSVGENCIHFTLPPDESAVIRLCK